MCFPVLANMSTNTSMVNFYGLLSRPLLYLPVKAWACFQLRMKCAV